MEQSICGLSKTRHEARWPVHLPFDITKSVGRRYGRDRCCIADKHLTTDIWRQKGLKAGKLHHCRNNWRDWVSSLVHASKRHLPKDRTDKQLRKVHDWIQKINQWGGWAACSWGSVTRRQQVDDTVHIYVFLCSHPDSNRYSSHSVHLLLGFQP